eukprot:Blabericola_migrator_1__7100@NODE_359_length_9439_cov_107_095070_g287_i0_p2_GENE_NODE_359_length_9439_cov_107_095070_g287_i0NODE_359_length_9439_cov_107_095070_g287_i0_p2_ORF_typecomplete_len534_score61_99Na_H_Exchanger/PF00999_21/1_7e24DUF5423/PF17461_2/1_1DUF5423/PF17461_2/2_1e02_NODE_359_length_9439_cov_107_095070_g287_i045466147
MIESESLLGNVASQVNDQSFVRLHRRSDKPLNIDMKSEGEVVKVRASLSDSVWTGTWFFKTLLRPSHSKSLAENLIRVVLTDPASNEFVLSMPDNFEDIKPDYRLMFDIVVTLLIAAVGGVIASSISYPLELGCLLAGMVLGGLRETALVSQPIQTNTLGHFGSIFLLLELGRSVSLMRGQTIPRLLIRGGALTLIFLSGLIGTLAELTGHSVSEAVLVAWCLFHSSTSVVQGELDRQPQLKNSVAGESLTWLLAFQDVSLGFMLSFVPYLNMSTWLTGRPSPKKRIAAILSLVLRLGSGLIVFGLCTVFLGIATLLVGAAAVRGEHAFTKVFPLYMICVLLVLSLTSHCCGLSCELGAFCTGLLFSLLPPTLHQSCSQFFMPIVGLFNVLYFGTLGLSINLALIWDNFFLLLILSLVFTVLKFALLFPLVCLAVRQSMPVATLVSVFLSQFGELVFLLLAKGRSYGVITGKAHHVLTGVTALSLLSCPLFLRLVHYYARRLYGGLMPREVSKEENVSKPAVSTPPHVTRAHN